MTEEIAALCRAMGASEIQEALLHPLARAACEGWAGRLRAGVEPADCGPAFPLAAAMTVMDRLSGVGGGGGDGTVTSFTAGDLTIKREAGSQSQSGGLSRQAEELLGPWLRDRGFRFQGVEG